MSKKGKRKHFKNLYGGRDRTLSDRCPYCSNWFCMRDDPHDSDDCDYCHRDCENYQD